MKKKGFTLIELLAVIVVLALTFLFIAPKISNLIKEGEETQKILLEEKIIAATRDYVTNNSDIYQNLINEGDYNYILKEELIDLNIVDEEDLDELTDFAGVKIELLEDDKIEYTIEYGGHRSFKHRF